MNLDFLILKLGLWSTSTSYTVCDEKPVNIVLLIFYFSIKVQCTALLNVTSTLLCDIQLTTQVQ